MIEICNFQFETEFNPESALNQSLVTIDENILSSEILLGVMNLGESTRVATRGNISCILGKAKSRKTFFITMICAAILRGELYGKFKGRKGSRVVIFDTEQGRWHVQQVLKRIVRLAECDMNLVDIYSLRKFSPLQRWEIIDNYFKKNTPDFVVIDGIRDLINDINSADQSTEISTQAMKWSEEKDCHIMTVLHMNKGDMNARGHLGTEIVNKSESVISVSKEKGDSYTKVESEYMRGMDFEPFNFEVIDGIPYICSENTAFVNGSNAKNKAPF
jgi:hypothetical protein